MLSHFSSGTWRPLKGLPAKSVGGKRWQQCAGNSSRSVLAAILCIQGSVRPKHPSNRLVSRVQFQAFKSASFKPGNPQSLENSCDMHEVLQIPVNSLLQGKKVLKIRAKNWRGFLVHFRRCPNLAQLCNMPPCQLSHSDFSAS